MAITWSAVLSGVSSLAVLVVFILAIRTSYAIERIANGQTKSIPTYTNLFSTTFGAAGKATPETRKLRTRLRIYLLIAALPLVGPMVFLLIYNA